MRSPSTTEIRVIGDPVLTTPSNDVVEVDDKLRRLTQMMFHTMYEAPGIGLAAPQVGVRKRFFVYDVDDSPQVVINPRIVESSGEWVYDEGCLSVPGLTWEIVRPKQIHIVGYDLEGNEVDLDADDLLARLFQHEIDHLDGVLLTDHLTDEQKAEARSALQQLRMRGADQLVEVDPIADGFFRRGLGRR